MDPVKQVAVFGPVGGYDFDARMAALAELSGLQYTGGRFADLSQATRDTLGRVKDSFTAPTFSILDELHKNNIPVWRDPLRKIPGDPLQRGLPGIPSWEGYDSIKSGLTRAIRDPRVGAFLQVGYVPPDLKPLFDEARQRGIYLGRVATDYGSGGFLQPSVHLKGIKRVPRFPGDTIGRPVPLADPSGMFINRLFGYDTVYVPGKGLYPWRNIPPDMHTVGLGGLANSPIFEAFRYSQTDPSTIKALLTTGGGSGLGMPFELEPTGNLGELSRRSLLHPKQNLLDIILSPLRDKAARSGKNYSLSQLTGLNPYDADQYWSAIYRGSPDFAREAMALRNYEGAVADVYIKNDIIRLMALLDKNNGLHKEVAKLPGGPQFLRDLEARYRGLNILPRMTQPELAEFFSHADTTLDIPGSTVGELSKIRGAEHGGMIHIIPREVATYPRHFYGNALATNVLMQPTAQHNIVRVSSPTFAQDMAKAINETGFRNWGRRPIVSSEASIAPLIEDVRNALSRRSFSGAPGAAGGAIKKLSTLFKIFKH